MRTSIAIKRVAAWICGILFTIVFLTMFAFHPSRPKNLGLTQGQLAPCPSSPNCVCSEGPTDSHFIAPVEFKGNPKQAMEKLNRIIRGMSRSTLIEERDDYLYAEFRSALFRFVDDAEFFLDPNSKRIQVRSASRVGRSDLGVNRRRVEEIRRQFAE